MSRAFVKETDRDPQDAIARPARQHPIYVTPTGLRQLQERLAQAQARGEARDAAALQTLLNDAQVVDPAQQTRKSVDFGARVTIELPGGVQQTYQIVGEDEADPLRGTLSWLSPLAQALWGKRPGSRAIWERPAGNVSVRVVAVEYR